MRHSYSISGMTCAQCVGRVKSELLKIGDVISADVQLSSPQLTIQVSKHIPVSELKTAVAKAGPYVVHEIADASGNSHTRHAEPTEGSYKPIWILGIYLVLITAGYELVQPAFSFNNWMMNFMAGFFLSFSFFKMLDLRGFADSYSTYDILASRWRTWGYLYAFIEAILGFAYLFKIAPLWVNGATFVVMSVSLFGVVRALMNKRKIQCACLGTVFNLPMSTITIVEDTLMILMSGAMLIQSF